MNLKQRTSRYGEGVLFMAGLAGVLLLAAVVSARFQPRFEIWLATGLVTSLILHARMGFALSRAQVEIDMLKSLSRRCEADPEVGVKATAPLFSLAGSATQEITDEDRVMLDRVRSAIENERLDLYLQPIVSLPQRKVRYYEAFSRMRDASGAVLKPADYLDAAERANRIGVIDNMILLRSIQALARLDGGSNGAAIFCNISPATLYDTDFFNHFTDYLEMYRDLAQRLVFEFTYPAVQMTHPRFEANLAAIARRGFMFSVDHVHTLDLDWAALRARNFRFAKASGHLLRAMSANEISSEALRGCQRRMAEAGVELIAEKIEFETETPAILALGLNYGQGNLFGPPQPAQAYIQAEAALTPMLAKAS